MPLAKAYIALGSNKGDRLRQMREALDLLESEQIATVLSVSPLYQNRAIGMGDAEDFFNGVAEVETTLEAEALLDACLAIESKLGRERGAEGWVPRTIDLDLLLYADKEVQTERLSLPHPRIAERDFVAIPLFDLNPELYVSGKPIRQIVDSLKRVELTQIKETLR